METNPFSQYSCSKLVNWSFVYKSIYLGFGYYESVLPNLDPLCVTIKASAKILCSDDAIRYCLMVRSSSGSWLVHCGLVFEL